MTSLRDQGESDDALMARVQRDDTNAFGELYDRHRGPAFDVAQSVCHNPGLAEDAVQEAFLSIWRGREGYRPRAGASFRAWAMETVRNRAIDSHRRRGATERPPLAPLLVTDLPEAPSQSPLDEVIERGERDALDGSLSRLPEAQAQVIALAFFGELTHVEIAGQLGLPEGTVKGRMRLGMDKLRRDMDMFPRV
jgi:RNA polymerase sigma-70 factor, ECF subfamily